MEKKNDAKSSTKVLDANSPATRYEVLLAEEPKGKSLPPTEQRMILVFQILDEITPHLGIYSRVLTMARDQLFDAVYSDQLTGTAACQSSTGKAYIQRLPYFTLVKRVYDARDETAEELRTQLNIVKKRLFNKQKQFEDAMDTISLRDQEIEEMRNTMRNMEEDLKNNEHEIESLEENLDHAKQDAAIKQRDLEYDLEDTTEDLTRVANENSYLTQFKTSYERLEKSFTKSLELDGMKMKKSKKSVVATKRAHLISDIDSARKMEGQLLAIQNAIIEEFDGFLEKQKSLLCSDRLNNPQNEDNYRKVEVEMERADSELQLVEERFKKSVVDLEVELSHLQKHRTMLIEQLQLLEENRPTNNNKKKSRNNNKEKTSDSLLSAGLSMDGTDDEDNPAMDPFIAQEHVFSKYAAMLYTSPDGGKVYHEFKDAKYCASCGEKTVICPHKIGNAEKVISLPPGSTHLKISRPQVKISQEVLDSLLKTVLKKEPQLPLKMIMRSESLIGQNTGRPAVSMATAAGGGSISNMGNTESYMKHTPQKLWADYKARTSLERTLPRPLTKMRLLSVVEEFCGGLLWQDDYGLEEDGFQSMLDNLYTYFAQRYKGDQVAYLATHDFLSGLVEYAGTSKVLQLFLHCLVDNLDPAILRYTLLLGDLIDRVDWKEMSDFRSLAQLIYPFASEDDLENLQMGYTSFSENKVSKQLVWEFIIYTILKQREPRVLECESKLLLHPGKEAVGLSEQEFSEAIDSLIPLTNHRLQKRLFQETQSAMRHDGIGEEVPLARLAQMSAYLSVLPLHSLIRDTLDEKIVTARGKATGTHHTTDHVLADYDYIITTTRIKNLAHNKAKCAKVRRKRETDNYYV